MGKLKSPLCKFRRRNKQNNNNNNPNVVKLNPEESEDELKFVNNEEKYNNFEEQQLENNNEQENNEENNENNDNNENFDNNENNELDVELPETPLNFEEGDLDFPHVDEESNKDENEESLNDLLDKMENDDVDLENLKNLSLTIDNEGNDLFNLQSYVSNKFVELIKKSSFGEKCIESLAPLCTSNNNGVECGPLEKLLSLGNGCLNENGNTLNENELQVPQKEEYKDPPTLPSGIKFVDDFNKLLDNWADQSTSNNYTANVFKLFNLSALLKHFGDPRYVEILNKLGVNNLLNNSESQKKWDQILQEVNLDKELPKKELPQLPNPKFISNCNTKLVDLPQLDNNNVDEHAFKLYWVYTNTWLNKMFGPSFRNSYKFIQPTKNWYMNMERASQLFFLRLSKTLCSVQ